MSSRFSCILSPNRDPPAAASPNAPSAAAPASPNAPSAAAIPAVASILPAAAPSLQAVLRNVNLYVLQTCWFQLIQDKDKEMTEMEKITYPPDSQKVKT